MATGNFISQVFYLTYFRPRACLIAAMQDEVLSLGETSFSYGAATKGGPWPPQSCSFYEGKSISKLQIVIEKRRMGIMKYKQHLFFNVISKQI